MKKQKNGYYRKQVYIGKKDTGKLDVEGNPIKRDAYKAVTGKTIQEVEEKVYHLKIQLGKGIDILASQDPFEKWAKMYLDEKKTEGLSNTYIGTLEQAMKHLAPIMQMPISKVEIQHLKAIINSLAPGIEPDPDRTVLSKRTLTGINQFAKRVFNLAIEYRAIDFNPANFVRIPKNAPQSSRSALTEEQQRWIVEYEHRAKRAAMIMLFAGLRRGEVGALTWGDIHLDEGYISVTKSVEFIKCQPWVKEPKTKAGIRTVDIPQILVDYLRTKRGKDDCMYVLHTQYGHMLSETTWCQIWKSYMKDLNVTYASDNPVNRYLKQKGGFIWSARKIVNKLKMSSKPFLTQAMRRIPKKCRPFSIVSFSFLALMRTATSSKEARTLSWMAIVPTRRTQPGPIFHV